MTRTGCFTSLLWFRDLAAGTGDHWSAGSHCEWDGHRLHLRVHPQNSLQVPLWPMRTEQELHS